MGRGTVLSWTVTRVYRRPHPQRFTHVQRTERTLELREQFPEALKPPRGDETPLGALTERNQEGESREGETSGSLSKEPT